MNNSRTLFLLILPFLGCGYAGWHIWALLPFGNLTKTIVVALLATCFALLFVNLLIGVEKLPLTIARVIYQIGTSSPVVLLYLVMLFLVLDICRLTHLIPASFLHNSIAGSLTVLSIIVAIFFYGNLHYYNKVRVPIALNTTKSMAKPLKIVLMSDLHLGYHNTRNDLGKWVDKINKEKADLILIAGDIIDISVVPLLHTDMAQEFRRLNAPVYATLGNHEYYAGEPNSEKFYHDAGIRPLIDTCIVFNNSVTIIGRDDYTNQHRKSLTQLTKQTDISKFTILLDHQPHHLEQARQAGIDFQFSGHTHYGQVWPINWIEDAIYEDAYGPLTKGHTHYYVSSGIGIWGGKFRIGTQSEYVVLTLTSVK